MNVNLGLILSLHPASEIWRYNCNDISHWLGTSLELALLIHDIVSNLFKVNIFFIFCDMFGKITTKKDASDPEFGCKLPGTFANNTLHSNMLKWHANLAYNQEYQATLLGCPISCSGEPNWKMWVHSGIISYKTIPYIQIWYHNNVNIKKKCSSAAYSMDMLVFFCSQCR